jgi:hypothetical protein
MKTVEDYNFRDDINDGEKGETIIANFLEGHNWTLISDNKDYKYDLKMLTHEKVETTVEIKTDVFCYPPRTVMIEGVKTKIDGKDTGNMFIEFESRGKDSGISRTEAIWFVMYFPYRNEAWFISVADLKELIANNNFRIGTGGDKGSYTKGYLINRTMFKSYFKVQKIEAEWDN